MVVVRRWGGVVQQGGAAREPRPFGWSTRLVGHLGERERGTRGQSQGESGPIRGWRTHPQTHLGCGGDDGLQRPRWGASGVAGVTAGVLCAVVVVVVGGIGGRALEQVLPARFDLRVEGGGARGGGGGRAQRSRGGGGGRAKHRRHPETHHRRVTMTGSQNRLRPAAGAHLGSQRSEVMG